MSAIKAIEPGTVHRIQSGQVIVDLCSVAKELVENGLDAGARSIEVRFKNQGLDSIEAQDNGSGISPNDYESVALKHYTSKLSTYSDLSTLETFGFRGEALSSLCALSNFTIVTCLQSEVPKGTRLDFEASGKLKATGVVAAQKGTTVTVANLFHNLPVRRRELERNIKREWGKVISLLNQYACIQTGVKFTVSQQPSKGRRIVLFSTKGNRTTRENIINVFGAKAMSSLIALDLKLELQPTSGPSQRWSTQEDDDAKEIVVQGYVSRPAHGEGRQTPDRQMFYVNQRPCALPQFAKVFNEVYRSYNTSQSPFIFANINLDTRLYDVNVSPDKRTIFLHDQSRMLDTLRDSVTELFETQDYTVPVSQIAGAKQTVFQKPARTQQRTHGPEIVRGSRASTVDREACSEDVKDGEGTEDSEESEEESPAGTNPGKRSALAFSAKLPSSDEQAMGLLSRWVKRKSDIREERMADTENASSSDTKMSPSVQKARQIADIDTDHDESAAEEATRSKREDGRGATKSIHNPDDNEECQPSEMRSSGISQLRAKENDASEMEDLVEPPIPTITKPCKPQEAWLAVAPAVTPPERWSQEVATIRIGDHALTSVLGTPFKRAKMDDTAAQSILAKHRQPTKPAAPLPSFGGRLGQLFSASAPAGQASGAAEHVTAEDEDMRGSLSHLDENNGSRTLPESDDHENASDGEKKGKLSADSAQDRPRASPASEGKVMDESDDGYDNEDERDIKSTAEEGETLASVTVSAGGERYEDNDKRSQAFIKGGSRKRNSTQPLLQRLKTSEKLLRAMVQIGETQRRGLTSTTGDVNGEVHRLDAEDAEERLTLIISKGDFGKMKIVGQFNLGFILAVRPAGPDGVVGDTGARNDELFIIDQHASDEKFNFERLQAHTVVQSQRLVRPKTLELTAVEEEIVIENQAALETNGFVVRVDESGDEPVGSRCELLSLPLSRETTFSLADLEELISLLGEQTSSGATYVPRPSKVRKIFAMRACRSSIMIGKALSQRQMEKVIRHMGEMEKPWNCPHGRPTLRHLCGLGVWEDRDWLEGDDFEGRGSATDWVSYMREVQGE